MLTEYAMLGYCISPGPGYPNMARDETGMVIETQEAVYLGVTAETS